MEKGSKSSGNSKKYAPLFLSDEWHFEQKEK